MTTTYNWRSGARVNGIDAQTAGVELSRLAKTAGLTAQRVVDKARPETSPLHPAFEWDDAIAAEEYRIHQARHMMRSVVVVHDGGEPTPLLIHVTHEKCGGSRYMPHQIVVSDADLREAALDEARGLLAGILRRFRDLDELAPVWEAIEGVTTFEAAQA